MSDAEFLVLQSNCWNHLTVGKEKSSGMFNMFANKLFIYKSWMHIIIIKSHWKLRFTWPSISIRPYHPSLPVDPPNCILCPHWADVNKHIGTSMCRGP